MKAKKFMKVKEHNCLSMPVNLSLFLWALLHDSAGRAEIETSIEMCCPSPDCPLVGIHGYCYRTWDNWRCMNLHKPSQCTRFHLVSFVVIWVDNVSDTCFKVDSFIRGWGRRGAGRDKEPGRVVALLPMVVFEIGLRVYCCLFQTRNHVLLILGYPWYRF